MVRVCLLVLVVNFCNAQSWVRGSIISGYSQDVSNNEYPKITSYMGYYLWVDSLIERTDSLLTIAIAIKEQRQKVLAEKLRRKEVALTTMSDEELDALLK